MAFCFLSSRLPSPHRIIYGNRLLEKGGGSENHYINSLSEKDRVRTGRVAHLRSLMPWRASVQAKTSQAAQMEEECSLAETSTRVVTHGLGQGTKPRTSRPVFCSHRQNPSPALSSTRKPLNHACQPLPHPGFTLPKENDSVPIPKAP